MSSPVPVIVRPLKVAGIPCREGVCQGCGVTRVEVVQTTPTRAVKDVLTALKKVCPLREDGKILPDHFMSSCPEGVILAFVHRPGTDGEKEIAAWAEGSNVYCVVGKVAEGSNVYCVVGKVSETVPIRVRYAADRYESDAQEFVKTLNKWGYTGVIFRDPVTTGKG